MKLSRTQRFFGRSVLNALVNALVVSLLSVGFAPRAHAGVFNLTRFIDPTAFALGLEPGIQLSSPAGLSFEAKFTYGLTELSNVQAFLGTGGGARKFRVGGAMTFDFFPDIDSQPGIGLAAQGSYVRTTVSGTEAGALEILAIPYIHKAFRVGSANEFEPFLSLPFGSSFRSGAYQGLWTLAAGSHFKTSEHLRTTLEVGVAIQHTESYVSGGVTYYH